MRTEAAASAARAPKILLVRPAGGRFVRLGLHLIALRLCCSAACELRAAGSVRIRDGAATRRGLQPHREPRSTSFRSAACTLSPAGHCAARGPRVHHRADQLADWPRPAVRFPIKCSNHELSYALLARACESFELCSHFKSLPPVSDRELSTNLTWRAHRRKPEFPALGSETQSRCVQGERGV